MIYRGDGNRQFHEQYSKRIVCIHNSKILPLETMNNV